MINIKCPSCQADYSLANELAGRKVQCEFCREKFRVPESAANKAAIVENKSTPTSSTISSSTTRSNARIEASCPRCLAEYKLAAKYAGQSVRCRDCKSIFKVANPNQAITNVQNHPADPIDDDLLEDVTPAHFFNTTTPTSATRPHPINNLEPEAEDDDLAAGANFARSASDDLDDRRIMRAAARKASQPAAGQADWDSFRPAPVKKKPKFESDNISVLKRLVGGILVALLIGLRGWLRFEARQARRQNAAKPAAAAPVKNNRNAANGAANDIGEHPAMLEAKREVDKIRRENPALKKASQFPPPTFGSLPQGRPPIRSNPFPIPRPPQDMPNAPGQGRPAGPPGQQPFF